MRERIGAALPAVDHALMTVAAAHFAVGLACLVLLLVGAPAVSGEHAAWKPMRFGFSIAVFLGSMAVLLPSLSASPSTRAALVLALNASMSIEMFLIGMQAIRGTRSHFNVGTAFDAMVWRSMFGAIVLATVTMAVIALLASTRPLRASDGFPLEPLVAAGWRLGTWCFLLAALSGFGMGGAGRHSVGGEDGGAGAAVVRWSTTHGDLRVSHFFALHGLQVLPLLGALLSRAPLVEGARWAFFAVVVAAQVVVVVGTLVQAHAARPAF